MKALLIGLRGVGQRPARNLRSLLPDAELLACPVRGNSHSLAGASDLAQAAEQAGRLAMVAYQLRFHPSVKERRRPIVDLHDGVTSLRMALVIKRSMSTGTLVSLDEPDLS